MLMFFDSKQTKSKAIQNANGFTNPISHLCSEEEDEVYIYSSGITWRFDSFTPKHVYNLYHHLRKSSITPTLQQAYEQELGLVEIWSGDARNPTQLLITPDLDIEAYQRQWLRTYWQVHGHRILEMWDTGTLASSYNEQGRSGQ